MEISGSCETGFFGNKIERSIIIGINTYPIKITFGLQGTSDSSSKASPRFERTKGDTTENES
jgi:hypothetical protein